VFTVRVQDNRHAGLADTTQFEIDVAVQPLVLKTRVLPSGTVGEAYRTILVTEGGTVPIEWNIIAGSLPPGLELEYMDSDHQSVEIFGTPAEAGSFDFALQVTDAGSPQLTDKRNYTLTIESSPLTISTSSPLPNATAGQLYEGRIEAEGGSPDLTWTMTSGTLPAGMVFRNAIEVAWVEGTPTETGTFSFTVQVTDNVNPGLSDTKTFTLTVGAPAALQITTPSLPNAVQYENYTTTVDAINGTLPYDWTDPGGGLPAGFDFDFVHPDNSSIDIVGYPNTVGTFNFTIRVTDSSSPQQQFETDFTLTVDPQPLAITTASPLPDAILGSLYEGRIDASGGSINYSWSMTAGTLPAGMSFRDAGESAWVEGTPTESGTFEFTVHVMDNVYNDLVDSKTFSLTVP
jgi:hypothetical protein